MLLFPSPAFLIDVSTSFQPEKKRESIVQKGTIESEQVFRAFSSALHAADVALGLSGVGFERDGAPYGKEPLP